MNPVAFTIGSWPVYWYGILIGSAFIIAVFLAQYLAKKRGYDIDALWTVMLITIPCAVIGARLYYVIFSWDMYAGDPMKIFQVWKGGLAVHGGILGGMIGAYLSCTKLKLDFLGVLDCIAPGLALGQAIGRWGNFINGEAYGSVTTLPWGIHVPDDPYLHHPTFLYESVWDLGLFVLLLFLFKKFKRTGNVTCVYFIVYSVGRFFIESLRTDSLMVGPLRQAQVISLCLIALAVFVLVWRNKLHPTPTEISAEKGGKTKKNKKK